MSEYTREEILKLIEENGGPEGLDLSGKDLSGIDLSREAIETELWKGQERIPGPIPAWYNARRGGINLREVNLQEANLVDARLQGASLGGANLQGADLVGTRLQGADLVGARLQGADLVGVNLQSADLVGANLQDASLGHAKLQGAKLEDANLHEANLFGANLQKASLLGANLQNAYLCAAGFQGAILNIANLQKADLWDAKLQGAFLRGAKLQGADLVGANLEGAKLEGANLQEANLVGAKLQEANLVGAELQGTFFSGVRLDHTEMDRDSLGPAIGEELAGNCLGARDAYLRLKQNFDDLGDYAASSWAYRKERRMEKLAALQSAKDAWQDRDWKGTIPHCAKVVGDQLVELVCDYGESVGRVLVSLVVVYLLFTLIYGLTWSVIRVRAVPAATIREPTRNLVDLLRFSLGAMTTMDLTGLEPRNGLVELVAGLEALLGIFLAGLLGFVAGNRIRRS